jgi:molecular chaperone HtpG
MTASITPINIAGIQAMPKPIEEDVVVGKDILDLLTGSMYVDPLNVYREYIQNAADAIDLAKDAEFKFESEPSIQIFIDNQNRNIRIRDNGISIPSDKFLSRVITIGASKKRGEKLRGFRGVGRLSGLGYCQTLIFRGRSEGDAKVTEVFWDGKKLKERYRDPDYNGTLTELVKEVTSVNRISPDNFPSRFFEVEMLKISRLKNDILLFG